MAVGIQRNITSWLVYSIDYYVGLMLNGFVIKRLSKKNSNLLLIKFHHLFRLIDRKKYVGHEPLSNLRSRYVGLDGRWQVSASKIRGSSQGN